MPTLPLHLTPAAAAATPAAVHNPLPQLLHTPSGLALLELQGSLNLPPPAAGATDSLIGNLIFPADPDTDKKVWLYIGKHQRMTGELRKLKTPMGIMRRRARADVNMTGAGQEEGGDKWEGEELEIAEVVRWKIVFSGRPEPVGNTPVGRRA